jgi:hypothetical protein
MTECVSFDDLFRPIAVDDGLQAVERPASHHVTNPLLLDPKSLNLEKQFFKTRMNSLYKTTF